MKNEKSKYLKLVVLFLLFVFGCTKPSNISENESTDQTLLNIESNANNQNTFSISGEPTQTQILPDIYALMSGENCIFPCIFGITPGVTSAQEAHELYTSVGMKEFYQDNVVSYYHFIKDDDENIQLSIDVRLHISDGVISRVILTLDIRDQALYSDGILGYTSEKILRENGIPEILYYTNNDGDELYNLKIAFASESVLYIYTSHLKENQVCLSPGIVEVSSISIIVDDLTVPSETIWDELNAGTWSAITGEVAFGIDNVTFFERLMNNPETCFPLLEQGED